MQKMTKSLKADFEKKMLLTNGITDNTEFIGSFPSGVQFKMIMASCRISFTAYFLRVKSIRSKMFFDIGVLKNSAIFTGKHLSWSLFLLKLQAFFKKRLQHRCFPVNIAKFLITPFFTEQLW